MASILPTATSVQALQEAREEFLSFFRSNKFQATVGVTQWAFDKTIKTGMESHKNNFEITYRAILQRLFSAVIQQTYETDNSCLKKTYDAFFNQANYAQQKTFVQNLLPAIAEIAKPMEPTVLTVEEADMATESLYKLLDSNDPEVKTFKEQLQKIQEEYKTDEQSAFTTKGGFIDAYQTFVKKKFQSDSKTRESLLHPDYDQLDLIRQILQKISK